MIVCECQNCGKEFEIEAPLTVDDEEKITCPYCYSGNVLIGDEEDE